MQLECLITVWSIHSVLNVQLKLAHTRRIERLFTVWLTRRLFVMESFSGIRYNQVLPSNVAI